MQKLRLMKKKFLDFFSMSFVVVFLLAVIDVAASKTASSQAQAFRIKSHPNFNKNFSGTAFVLDGDSIKVGKKEVRLFGLDSPEYSQTCFNEKDEEYSCGQVLKLHLPDHRV